MLHKLVNLDGYTYIKTTLSYSSDERVINEIVQKAIRMTGTVNPHSPDGKLRQQDTRFHKLLGGLVAETTFLNYLQTQADSKKITFELIDSSFSQDEDLSRMGFNQIDAKIRLGKKTHDIEIRSSFSYKTTLSRLFGVPLINGKGAFSLIGWYSSRNKPMEVKKDYYIFAIHFYEPSEIQERIFDSIEVYLAAAASKQTLEEKGEYSSLKQDGAKFRIINPLNSIDDPVKVIDEILS